MKLIIDNSIVLTNAISANAKNLYLNLLNFAHDSVTCYPTHNYIAEKLNISSRTVIRYMAELYKYGLLKVYREDGKLKANNNYIIVPVEWVDFETTYTEEDYVLNLAEYEALKSKILDFYETEGEKIIANSTPVIEEPKKAKQPRVVKTLDVRYEEVMEKTKKNSEYKYNASDCCVIFAKYLQDTKGLQCSISNARNNSIMKKNLVGASNSDIELVIKTFIDIYDTTFKSEKYPTPEINSLGVSWVLNKVVSIVAQKKKYEIAQTDTDICYDVAY